jgi:ubiquitin-conjugating enzyme E2 Q
MGMPLAQLLQVVSKAFQSQPGDDLEMIDSQYDEDGSEEEYLSEEEEGEEFYGGDGVAASGGHPAVSNTSHKAHSTLEFRSRIRSDLNWAKTAGFKVGHHGQLMDGSPSYVSISCRISKLGISEEAMQAWQLEASEYLIFLIFYPNGYRSVDNMKSYDASTARRNVEFRVGVSHTYKPTLQECHAVFTKLSSEEEAKAEMLQAKDDATVGTPRGFRNTFISRPLNDLLNERLPTIIKYRYIGMHWTGAEEFYNDHQGKTFTMTGNDCMEDKYMNEEPIHPALPGLVTNDHLSEREPHSFPLLGMQFLLRHFVRCTEFCLVCHCKLEDTLEALKPYVCEKPLCLYQYMSLGFGPSIEHEIISQPYVVDLLVSFCYQSALGGRLNSFPNGLSLSVPAPNLFNEFQTASSTYVYYQPQQPATPAVTPGPSLTSSNKAKLDRETREVLFEKGIPNPVKVGDWIVIQPASQDQPFEHCRVIETHLFPVIRVTKGVTKPSIDYTDTATYGSVLPAKPKLETKPTSAPVVKPSGFEDVTFYVYDVNFDELTDHQKRGAIVAQLDLLPGVVEIKEYLTRNRMATLANWSERISPTASGILRWIIASNRACIVQVDNPDQSDKKGEARLPGMEGWMQFRFAMGAPDKERRFISSVQETRDRLKLNHPTLFAWHGSPLANWHGIIREGLHFKDALHGRAYGNGVYHSLDFNTSQGYSGMSHYRGGGYGGSSWPASELKVSVALALNEIVNAPAEYVSRTPHLVVAQLDWIQTRYLFVQCNGAVKPGEASTPSVQFHDQDPTMTPNGPKGKIVIPLDAMPKSRRGGKAVSVGKGKGKKKMKASGSAFDPISIDIDDDDTASIATDVEDLNVLIEDEDMYVSAQSQPKTIVEASGKSKETRFIGGLKSFISKASKPSKPLTDFLPGTLDYSGLPLLQPPTWATSSATKRLQKEYQTLLKVQETHPLHELGWYTDSDKLDNVYQWIIELHSFEEDLPLAKQMKQKGIKSVVIEMRFGKDYPMAPPFIRVIRPRFLSFMAGGGGHVTAGGSICMEVSPLHLSKRQICIQN